MYEIQGKNYWNETMAVNGEDDYLLLVEKCRRLNISYATELNILSTNMTVTRSALSGPTPLEGLLKILSWDRNLSNKNPL